MPATTGQDAQGCYARWGDTGTRYRYPCGDEQAEAAAIEQAKAQGRAIEAQRGDLALSVTFPKAPALTSQRIELVADDDWRMAFAWGQVKHHQGDFTVDRRFAANMIEAFRFMRDTYGYYPPIAAEHQIRIDFEDGDGPQVIDGVTFGVISDIQTRDSGIWVRPMFNALGEKLNLMGAFAYVSPSFYPVFEDPHSERELRNMLREFTVCGNPHQKNLQTPVGEVYGLSEAGFLSPPHDTNAEEFPMANNEEPNENQEDEGMEGQAGESTPGEAGGEEGGAGDAPPWAQKMMQILAKIVSALEPASGEGAGGDADGAPAEAALQNANKRIAKLERRVALSEALVSVQADHPHVSEQEALDLAEIRMDDPAKYKRLTERLRKATEFSETPEQGKVGAPAPTEDDEVDADKIRETVADARDKDIKRGLQLVSFCNARGIDHEALNSVEFKSIVDSVYAGT